jgi:arylsulfatase A-like enzyme
MLEQEKIAPFWIQELIEAGYGTFVLNTFGLDYNGISLQSFQRHIPETTLQKANFIEVMTYAELPKIKEMLVHFEKIVQDFKEHPEKKNGIFCYIHSSITHMPWIPKKPIFGNETIDLYDASVKDVDDLLGFFLEELKKLGLYDDAIIIILADHGTGLMEHGRYGSFLNYEEQIRVPLLFRIPNAGIKPHVSSEFVQLIDLGPTLINMVSNVKKNRFHGISLLGAIRGKPLPEKREYLFALSSFEDLYSLIAEEKYKFHYHRRYGYYKLYDLSQDPMERNNLADQKKDLVEKYFSVMDQFLRAGNYSYNNPYHYKDFDPKNQ